MAFRSMHLQRTSRGLALALALAAVVLAGCGGGDGATAKPPLSKRIYVERFNDVQREAPSVFANVSEATRDPKAAQPHLTAFDGLIKDLDALDPPRTWRDEHRDMLTALREMRAAVDVLSRAPAGKAAIVQTQLGIYRDAESDYAAAVARVNASR